MCFDREDLSFIVEEKIEEYAAEHTTPVEPLFDRLAAETRDRTTAPQMMVGVLEGRFLSIAMAHGLPDGGRVITCDVDEETTEIARRYAEEAGVVDWIDYRLGPALETIASLDGPFDLVFIDADKPNYVNYYEAVLPKLAGDGLIVADNVLWSGRVLEDDPEDEGTSAIKEFNDHVRSDERVEQVMLTVRDGMTLIRKR